MPRKRKFGGLSPNSIYLGKSSGPNGIRHPHWVKLYAETDGQNYLRAKHTKSFCYKSVLLFNYSWEEWENMDLCLSLGNWHEVKRKQARLGIELRSPIPIFYSDNRYTNPFLVIPLKYLIPTLSFFLWR